MPKGKSIYRSSLFFCKDFPFSITRLQHTAKMYNENTIHCREFWKIIYVVAGKGWKLINKRRHPLKAGGLFLVHPEDETSFIIESKNIEICNILFMPEFLGNGISDLRDEYRFFSIFHPGFKHISSNSEGLYVLETDRQTKQLIGAMEREYQKRPHNFKMMLRLGLTQLLILMVRKGETSLRKRKADDVVKYVEHMIGQHYYEKIDLTVLSDELAMDKSSLCRLYKKKTGMTIMDKLRIVRIIYARQHLANPSKTIADACYDCGFHDLSYFYRTFKKNTGTTPGEYRIAIGLH